MAPLVLKSSSSGTSILVIGGTGTIGRHLVTASLDAGHPTAVLVRPAAAAEDPAKASLLEAFKTRGASLIYGDINDAEALVAAIKQAGDVVISATGHSSPEEVESQLRIVAAIKEAGNVKRFLPSEYGCDVEHVAEHMVEPARSILGAKVRVRHALKAAGIPHTIVCSNWAQGFLLPRAGDPQLPDGRPPDTTATIFGDGQVQATFVNEQDMSRVAIKAVQDPRTLNKKLHLAIVHASFIAAGRAPSTKRNIHTKDSHGETMTQGVDDVDATQLYPGISYITVKDYLDALPPHNTLRSDGSRPDSR
ncbi:NmrA-like negative transcriptional regulator family protein [Zea mays]|uniref:NmrA-like negative transcriptional regulator family protein n=1 Tax=Zea mays TaxID=4577 RepID=A0A1D6L6U7_MAIZE|nr:NmrA-like negative transcriptional regulator family protein [Zea mays]